MPPSFLRKLLQARQRSQRVIITPSLLNKLPSEIRLMIFEECIAEPWTGKMPALIMALRGEEHLHVDAMHCFLQMNHTYVLHKENDWGFGNMSHGMIGTVRKVKIMIDETIALHPFLSWTTLAPVPTRYPHSLQSLSATASLCTSVTSVTLDCRPRTTNLYYYYPQKFTHYLSGFPNLTYVAMTCPVKPDADLGNGGVGMGVRDVDGYLDVEHQRRQMEGCLNRAERKLGVKAKTERVWADKRLRMMEPRWRRFVDREVWVWVAPEGETLKKIELPEGLAAESP